MFVYVKKIFLLCSVKHSVTYKVTVFFYTCFIRFQANTYEIIPLFISSISFLS